MGYSLSGAICRQDCPDGSQDKDYYCKFEEMTYGRGVGYPWKFGDGPGQDFGMQSRCEYDHGIDNCEKSGLIFYPKCKPGFSPVGCCICRAKPECNTLGMGDNIFSFSCLKKVQAPNETVYEVPPTGCADDEVNKNGLCYKKC
jgi:hypothetical protein